MIGNRKMPALVLSSCYPVDPVSIPSVFASVPLWFQDPTAPAPPHTLLPFQHLLHVRVSRDR